MTSDSELKSLASAPHKNDNRLLLSVCFGCKARDRNSMDNRAKDPWNNLMANNTKVANYHYITPLCNGKKAKEMTL